MNTLSQIIKKRLKEIRIIAVLYWSFKEYRLQIVGLVFLGFASGILEGIGINALIPLFSFFTDGEQAGTDIISQSIEKLFLFFHIDFTIPYLLIFIFSLFILRTAVLFLLYYVKIKISADYEEKIRTSLLQKTFHANWSHLLQQKLGKLDSLLLTHVQFGSNALLQFSSAIIATTVLIVYVAVSLNISFIITLVSFVLGVVSLLVFKPVFAKTMHIGKDAAVAVEEVAHFVNQNILGMKTVKYMGVGDSLLKTGVLYFRRLKEQKVKVYIYKNFSPQILQLISLLFICALFGISYRYSYLNVGALVAIIYLVQRMFSYVQQIQISVHSMSESLPYLEGVTEYGKQLKNHAEPINQQKSFVFDHTLAFDHVSFSYTTGPRVLHDINFEIKKGERVAIIGPSGAGKTTMVDVLLRLFQPTGGRITVDGVLATEISLVDWRNTIGYMSQDMFLLNDSILNNIIFYDPNITRADAILAAKKASIYDFIESCQDGIDSFVGERGVSLSVGQRQRIVIARILARKPKVLILDEATSALDTESEMHIQEVIDRLHGDVTVVLIAHRLSTVKNADSILVVDNGKIVERGSPRDLLQDKNSYFYRMSEGAS